MCSPIATSREKANSMDIWGRSGRTKRKEKKDMLKKETSLIITSYLLEEPENYFHSEVWVLQLLSLALVKTRIVCFIWHSIFSPWWSNESYFIERIRKCYLLFIIWAYFKIITAGHKACLLRLFCIWFEHKNLFSWLLCKQRWGKEFRWIEDITWGG